ESGNAACGCGHHGMRAAIHRTPWSASGWSMVIARRHDAGGARSEQPRQKTCSTTIAWPPWAHTKFVARAVAASSADAAHTGGVQRRVLAEEPELAAIVQLLQFLQEASPEQPGQHAHRQEEPRPAGHPA